MAANRILLFEKLRGTGIFLISIATMLLSIGVYLLVRQNETLEDRLDCRAVFRDQLDEAVGRGLVAVARDDPAALETQASNIIEIVETQEC